MLRSVDIQQILLQTGTLEKIQQVQQQQAEMGKRFFALQFQKEIAKKQKEVQGTKGSEKAKIGEKERQRKQQRELATGSNKNSADESKPQKRILEEIDQGKILDLIV